MEFSLSGAIRCMDSERDALLTFKGGFRSGLDRFSSWKAEEDCCKWRGVGCDNVTGHVTKLDLHSPDPSDKLQGEISQSLLHLPNVRYLDLSQNNFNNIPIPEFIGSLQYIEYLNLSNANFRGPIPSSLGNLSHLEYLDLSGNGFSLKAKNLNWVYGLSFLKVLDLSGVDLSSAEDWLDAINMLSSLVELHLFYCKLHKLPQYLHHVNFTSLKILDLSDNNFNSPIPDWLFEIGHSVVYLNLSICQLQGLIPDAFGNMTSLTYLDLSKNNLKGPIPLTLGLFQKEIQLNKSSSLRELYLSDNQLNGSLEQSLVQLSQLVALNVARNYLEGNITEAHLKNFSSLRLLDLSSNQLVLNVSSSWIPPFQLETIGLGSCLLGPKFPQWLRSQNNYSSINISYASIVDVVPDWFWNLSSRVKHMDLSFNELKGNVPDFSSQLQLSLLDLSHNYFRSRLPRFSVSLRILALAENSFFGSISHLCGILSVDNSIGYLDLSSNNLSGKIPDCWEYGQNLVILNLANNNLSGQIPNSICHLINLKTLRLDNNSLSGEVTSSLKNCFALRVLGLAHNKLSGNVLELISENLQYLMILELRYNTFSGHIPLQMCRLKNLKILDLASNNLSGTIPRCVFDGMTSFEETLSLVYYPYTTYSEGIKLTVKSKELVYSTILRLVKLLDLSSNNLSGEIPTEVTSLVGLQGLNLSRNHLVGPIPPNTGKMESLEALDLSRNHLSCTMPASMSSLTFLSHLDVSHNNLSGEIPHSTQLQALNYSSFMGNPQLCGFPLSKICSRDELFEDSHCSNEMGDEENHGIQKEGHDGFKIPSFYLSSGLGFITGFWGLWGSLILNRSWRHSYFRFLGNMSDKIYVTVVVGAAKLQRKFQRQQTPPK
ncbi:receptor-like protein EIX2 [Quercus robur]|uniref:receptor-like protein EIX2 n=1 Tax=Quercus robur TaxID=38942 RepID=UPI002162B768|nr:receptor-like protein EIX2 [Quercus robur]